MTLPRETVELTGLAWGVRSSFRRYVHRMALGSELPVDGAGLIGDGRLFFPVVAVRTIQLDPLEADVSFGGGVHFSGHAGLIDLRLGEFELHIHDGAGEVRTSSPGGMAVLALVSVVDLEENAGLLILRLSGYLAEGAEYLFNDVYSAGTDFDEMEIRLEVA